MDALTLLTADHNRVRGLFSRFDEAKTSGEVATMHELVRRLIEDLEIHTRIEEEIFYPAVRDLSDEVHELVAEGEQEHHLAKVVMGELQGVEPGSEEWIAKATVLQETIEHHAEEEETEMWPGVRSGMDAAQRDDLGERLMQRKLELGAPPPAIDLTKQELLEMAREQSIPNRNTLSKDELAATVDRR